jgi:succinate dehydrogenase/fumarate reductase-like Fe-S protein
MEASEPGQAQGTMTLEVFRYQPDDGAEPRFQAYEVPFRPDWVVLDALNHIKDELEEYKQYSMCINCMLCYAACPIYGLDPKFIGPAAIARAQRYNFDSRDEGAGERMEVLSEHEGIWGCTFVGECTKVCPKHVDPAGAIQRYKLSAAMEEMRSFFVPRGA